MKRLFHGTGILFVCVLFNMSCLGQASNPEALVTQILTALETKDQYALSRLQITDTEVKKFVWPAVSSRMAGNTVNADKFTAMYRRSSDLGMTSMVTELGGRKWQLVKVAVNSPNNPTRGYRLLPAPLVTIRDTTGTETTVRIVGGILERDGVCKVATYYTISSIK